MQANNRRETAEGLFRDGNSVADIARQLDISASTVASWKRRYGWEITDSTGRLRTAFEERLEYLIGKPDKNEDDWREIDRHFGYVERLERLSKQFSAAVQLPDDPEDSPHPNLQDKPKKKKRGRPKAGEKNVIDADMVDALVTEFERLCFAYQWEWWEARHHDGRCILKSRQIGATFYFALEALIIAITTGKNQIFVSASKKQAAQFRRNIIKIVSRVCDLELQGDPMRIKLPDHEAGEVYLYFLGTQVSSVQGYSGDLYLDECGWVRNFEDIQEVASAMALQAAYRETYFTTPSTMDHDFYKFWTGTTYNKDRPKDQQIQINVSHKNLKDGKLCDDGYWRQIVTLEDAIAAGCTLPDGRELFDLEKVRRKYSPARYAMLCECKFTDHTASVFNFKKLYRAMVEVAEVWDDFQPLIARPLGDLPVWIGFDPSGEGEDAAAIVVVCPPVHAGDKYRVVEVIRMDDADYEEQAQQIRDLINKYNVTYIGVDNQGIGDGVYQMVQKDFPSVTAMKYTPESKAGMVMKTKSLLKRDLLEIDNVYLDEIMPAMLAIQRNSTGKGTMTYTARRSEDTGHADVAWALLHALDNADFETLISAAEHGAENEALMEIF